MDAALLLELYWTYVKIGFTSFGGISMIPVLSREMLSHGWMNMQEINDIIAIAEMTPGPLGTNCASFVGTRIAGLLGCLITNLGVLTPTLTLTMTAAVFLEKFRNSHTLQNMMTGIRPAACAMIVATILSLSQENYLCNGNLSIPAVVIGVIDYLLLDRLKWPIPLTILLSAGLGLLLLR